MVIKLNKAKDGLIEYKCYEEEDGKRYLSDKGCALPYEIYDKLFSVLENSKYVNDVNSSKFQFYLSKYVERNNVLGEKRYTILLDEKLGNDMEFAALLNKLVRYYLDRMHEYNSNIEAVNNNKKNIINVCNGVADYASGHLSTIDKNYARELKAFIDMNKHKIIHSDYWKDDDIIGSDKTKTNKFWFVASIFGTCFVPALLFMSGLVEIPFAIFSFFVFAASTMILKEQYITSENEDNKKALEAFRTYLDTLDDGFEPLNLTKSIDPYDKTKNKVIDIAKVDFEPINDKEDSLEVIDLGLEESSVEFEDIPKLIYKP